VAVRRTSKGSRRAADIIILENARRHNLRMTERDGAGRCRHTRRAVLGPYKSKTELLYAKRLAELEAAREIAGFRYEPCRINLVTGELVADRRGHRGGPWYTPDFRVDPLHGPVEYHEVKGFWRTADRLRWRIASALHPEFTWRLVRLVKGRWSIQTVEAQPSEPFAK